MIREVLEKIVRSEGPERERLIKEFQQYIWDDPNDLSVFDTEVLAELAHDLDFYESDENARKEDPSFYGDERLEREIRHALEKLKAKEI